MTADNIRDREELQEQIRALGELKMMAETYGFDISNPATNTQEAIQWMYFAYLAAVKEQNGAAMSIGRTSTFIDIYAERDLANGTFTEEQIQEFVDHFIMKLRMVKFARTPEYQALFTGDPQWVTESIGGMGVAPSARELQEVLRQDFCRQLLDPVRERRPHARLPRRRLRYRLLRVLHAHRQGDAVLRRPCQPGQVPALRAQRRC